MLISHYAVVSQFLLAVIMLIIQGRSADVNNPENISLIHMQ
jgi:hypothetical protein